MAAAKRELEEEAGLIADGLTLLTVLYPSPGYTNEKIYIYEATSVRRGERHPDSDEFLNVEYIPFGEACNMVARGEIKDAKTVAALLYYRQTLVVSNRVPCDRTARRGITPPLMLNVREASQQTYGTALFLRPFAGILRATPSE